MRALILTSIVTFAAFGFIHLKGLEIPDDASMVYIKAPLASLKEVNPQLGFTVNRKTKSDKRSVPSLINGPF